MPAIYQKKMVRKDTFFRAAGSLSPLGSSVKLAGSLQHFADVLFLGSHSDMGPLQRLWHDVERAVPHLGAQVPWLQLLQHPADEGRSSCML